MLHPPLQQLETQLALEVSAEEQAIGEHKEPPVPRVNRRCASRADALSRGRAKAKTRNDVLTAAPAAFAAATAAAMKAHAACPDAVAGASGFYGDPSLTGKRQRAAKTPLAPRKKRVEVEHVPARQPLRQIRAATARVSISARVTATTLPLAVKGSAATNAMAEKLCPP